MKLCIAAIAVAALLFQQPSPDALSARIFIGQVYPSGNVYMKPFATGEWPKEITLVPLVNDRPTAKASLSSETMQTAYIPALEGMDDQHDPCGSLPSKKLDTAFEYLSDEFFNSMVDYCESSEDVALYRTATSQFSYMVLGFAPDAPLQNVVFLEGPRPMTPAEKEQLSKEQVPADCSTVPAFIDSAARLLEAGIGSGLSVRLSSYKNPGCAGHLSTIYIIDVLRGNSVLTTFQLIQNQGLL
jgi:hypothetical protein